jgi:hypothetical protein
MMKCMMEERIDTWSINGIGGKGFSILRFMKKPFIKNGSNRLR